MDDKQRADEFTLRSFKPGDEASLVALLNLCYPGGWGSREGWEWRYPHCPSFQRENIFVIESNNQIIGHGGLHLGELIIRGNQVSTGSDVDGAVHPAHRGSGLWTRLHQARSERARSKGVCLSIMWPAKGSITYNHYKKTGFIEVKQSHTYLKPINEEKVFKGELSDFIAHREELKCLLQGLGTNLHLRFGEAEFSLDDLLHIDSSSLPANNKKGEIRIVLAKTSLHLLGEFVSGGKLRKIKAILLLFLSRKLKIRFSSPIALLKVARTGIRIVAYV